MAYGNNPPEDFDEPGYEAEGVTPGGVDIWEPLDVRPCAAGPTTTMSPTSYLLTSGDKMPPKLVVAGKIGQSGARGAPQIYVAWCFWLDRGTLFFGENDGAHTTTRRADQHDQNFLRSYLSAVDSHRAARIRKHLGQSD